MAGDDPAADGAAPASDGRGEVLLSLPASMRADLRKPFGPVFETVEDLLAVAGEPLVAVGDVVTHHLRTAGREPDVAVVDGYTERTPVDPETAVDTTGGRRVPNPAGTLTAELLSALAEALAAPEPRLLVVDGEEDLATLAALVAVPDGASVVYGQPGEGMVHVRVDEQARRRGRDLFDRLEGDHDRALAALGSTE